MFHIHLKRLTDLTLALVAGFILGLPVGAFVTLGYEELFTNRLHITTANRVDIDSLNVKTFMVNGQRVYIIGDYYGQKR